MNRYARSRQRLEALKDLGHEVEGLSYLPLGTNINLSVNLIDRIKNKLGFPLDLVEINTSLINLYKSYQPEIIWIDKVHTIKPQTYREIKKFNPEVFIIYYSEDDIYLRHNRSRYLSDSLSIFDLVFSTKPRNAKELPRLGVRDVYCIYQAFDKNFHRPMEISEEERERWGSDVTFVGFCEADRANKLYYLAENGVKVRVWGINWDRFTKKHHNLKVENRPVTCDDYIKVINATKINLNFLRKMNRDEHTSRSLEIPACASFMLAERTQEHLNLFKEGVEAEFFSINDEMLVKVKYYLSHEQERKKIANLARKRCLESNYSHHGRLSEMISYIESKKSSKVLITS